MNIILGILLYLICGLFTGVLALSSGIWKTDPNDAFISAIPPLVLVISFWPISNIILIPICLTKLSIEIYKVLTWKPEE